MELLPHSTDPYFLVQFTERFAKIKKKTDGDSEISRPIDAAGTVRLLAERAQVGAFVCLLSASLIQYRGYYQNHDASKNILRLTSGIIFLMRKS